MNKDVLKAFLAATAAGIVSGIVLYIVLNGNKKGA